MGLEACAVYGYGFQLSDDDIIEIYRRFMIDSESSDREVDDSDGEFVEYPEDLLMLVLSYISDESGTTMTFRRDSMSDPTYYIFFEDLAVECCGEGVTPCSLSSSLSKNRSSSTKGASTSDSITTLVTEDHIEAMRMFNKFTSDTIICGWHMYIYLV